MNFQKLNNSGLKTLHYTLHYGDVDIKPCLGRNLNIQKKTIHPYTVFLIKFTMCLSIDLKYTQINKKTFTNTMLIF